MRPSELLDPVSLDRADRASVEQYNNRARPQYRLQTQLGACAFEGAIDTASVVLLLANPGFDSTSTSIDHVFRCDDWPLSGLHPHAPEGLRNWWHARLRHLVEHYGAQRVSKRVAALQLTPWASEAFDSALRLPSRSLILSVANQLAARGAVLLVMRCERQWLESDGVRASSRRFRARSVRSSYVSPNNFGDAAWGEIVEAVGRSRGDSE